jgi:hypothetical protein
MKVLVRSTHSLYAQLERPVTWQEHPFEGFVSDNQGRDHSTRVELVLDETGQTPAAPTSRAQGKTAFTKVTAIEFLSAFLDGLRSPGTGSSSSCCMSAREV